MKRLICLCGTGHNLIDAIDYLTGYK
jgi:hypothetical protein